LIGHVEHDLIIIDIKIMKLSMLFRSNFITIRLIIVSLVCLYPSLTEPIMSLRVGQKK